MARKKALARKITFKDARSYRQTFPNSPMGVTAIAAVNGRGAYAKRYQATRRMLANRKSIKEMRRELKASKMPAAMQDAALARMAEAQGYSAADLKAEGLGASAKPKKERKVATKRKTTKKTTARRKAPVRKKTSARKTTRRKAPARAVTKKTAARKAGVVVVPKGKGHKGLSATEVSRLATSAAKSKLQKVYKTKTGKPKAVSGKVVPKAKIAKAVKAKKAFQSSVKAVKSAEKRRVVAKKRVAKAKPAARRARVTTKAPIRKSTARKSTKGLTKAQRAARARRLFQRRYKNMMEREARRTPARKGPFTAVRARIGSVGSRQTYMRETATGSLVKIPVWAQMGFVSAADFRDHFEGDMSRELAPRKIDGEHVTWREYISRRMKKIQDRRERDAERIRKRGGVFTPNKRRGRRTRALTYKEWESAMKKNAGRKRRRRKVRRNKASAKQRAAARRNIKKAQAARRRKMAKRAVRRNAVKRTKVRRRVVRRAAPMVANRRRRRRRKSTKGRKVVRRVRRLRRNQAFVGTYSKQLLQALKLGAVATVGYVTHRVLSKLVTENLIKTGEYKDLLSGALVAAVGVPLSVKFAPKDAKVVSSGMMVSLLQSLVSKFALDAGGKWGQYLGGFGGLGRGLGRGLGSYYSFQRGQVYPRAVGEYYSPMAGFGQLTQAAAGVGQLTQAAAGMGQLTQAAAGMGQAQIYQAAAGAGEYVATDIAGVGDYEEVVPEYSPPEDVKEGIMPDLTSAEYALSVAEGQMGIGQYMSLPAQSQINPGQVTASLNKAPDGTREGIYAGKDGIFGS